MARAYEEVVSKRKAAMAASSAEDAKVFEQAYRLAMEVVRLREEHGLTQAQLADRCGMHQADISRIERGSTSPTARVLQRIADALDADVKLVARA